MWKKKKEEEFIPSELAFDKKWYRIKEYHHIDGDKEYHQFTPQFNMSGLKVDQTIDHRGGDLNNNGNHDWVYLDSAKKTMEQARQVCYKLRPKQYKDKTTIHEL